MDKYTDLKHQLHVMTTKEMETQEELLQTKKTLDLTTLTFEQKLLSLEKENHKIQEDSVQVIYYIFGRVL